MGITVSEFQLRTGLAASSASIVLNFLVDVGLATVTKEQRDGRKRLVYKLADTIKLPA